MVIRCLYFFFALSFSAGYAEAAEVDIRVEPELPAVGESFRIAFTVRGEVNTAPEFAELEPLVEILGRNRQTSIQWINGKYTRATTWVLEVIAKTQSDLVIPALTIGKSTSPPQTIRMRNSTSTDPDEEGLFLEVDATPRNPYVQQQVTYTIRLWRRFELSNASLSEPRLNKDAIVRPLGEDRHLSMEKNGKAYEVIERRFVIFPQVSGDTEIAPATVTAQVVTRGFSLFDMFGQSVKTRRVTSTAIALAVRPIPAAFPSHANWLPASKVRLNEVWEPPTLTASIGEPVTRTVTIWAESITSAQLPDFAMEFPYTLKTYPDQPQLKDSTSNGTLTAIREKKIALIPTLAGPIELTPIELPWWNTTTDTLEIARLPGQTLSAAPGANEPATMPQTPALSSVPIASIELPNKPLLVDESGSGILRWRGWFWIAVISVSGWVCTAWCLWRRSSGAAANSIEDKVLNPASMHQAQSRVSAACRANDPRSARTAVLSWAELKWPTERPHGLNSIAARVTEPLTGALSDLNRTLYQQKSPTWNGEILSSAFAQHLINREHREPPAGELPRLFRFAPE
ncbi:MAG: protein BatD [Gammaproteobacteria bacterium]|nr:protein BatD [Gammaproteobacteria bacterium]